MAARTKSKNLPPRMYSKTGKKKRGGGEWITYIHVCIDSVTKERTETTLGTDYEEALRKYEKLEREQATKVATMKHAFDRYVAEVVPTKAPRTRKDTEWMLKPLRKVFDKAPMDQVTPQIVAKYRDERSKTAVVRANREMALLSTVWNYAREWGYTEKENPCRGVRKNKETPRDFYADDQTWLAVYRQGCPELQNAMDLAYLTGQRPTDVLGLKFSDIQNNALHLQQDKTSKKLNILLTDQDGERNQLGLVIDRILAEGGESQSEFMICNTVGGALNTQTLRLRFNKAKAKAKAAAEDDQELIEKINRFQFRDIRPKAASELPLEHASALLGHTKEQITKKVYQRKGATVAPTK